MLITNLLRMGYDSATLLYHSANDSPQSVMRDVNPGLKNHQLCRPAVAHHWYPYANLLHTPEHNKL